MSVVGGAGAPAPPGELVLGCRDLTVAFGQTIALDGVTLGWSRRGEIHSVVGQNGAGKTTLCRVLAGLTRADQGEVIIEGMSYGGNEQSRLRRAGVELVHQTFALPPNFTVAESLQLFRPGHAMAGAYRRSTIEKFWAERLEELGFHVPVRAWVRDLAPDQVQAVEITRALSSGSKVIVLDEPTAVLPPEAIEGLFSRLRSLAGTGITFLVVMHKLRHVRELAGTVAVLAGGRVVLSPTDMGSVDDEEIARHIMGLGAAKDLVATSAAAIGLGSGTSVVPAPVLDPALRPEPADVDPATPVPEQGPSAGPDPDREVAPSGPPVLAVDRVSVPSAEGRRGLRAFSVTVAPGEIVGIAGVEGNGQQALADVVVGLLRPSGGEVRIRGREVSSLRISARRRLGMRYIPADRQSRAVSLSSPLWVNAMAAPVSSGYGLARAARTGFLSERKLRAAGDRRLRAWGVRYSSSDQAMRELSGGNLQRVVLARELDETAALVVAEQPTQGLDLGGTELVWDALRRSAGSGVAVLLVSSDLDELFALSERIVVILDGERVEELRPPYDRVSLGRAMVVGASS